MIEGGVHAVEGAPGTRSLSIELLLSVRLSPRSTRHMEIARRNRNPNLSNMITPKDCSPITPVPPKREKLLTTAFCSRTKVRGASGAACRGTLAGRPSMQPRGRSRLHQGIDMLC